MKNRLFYTFGLMVLLLVVFVTGLAWAGSGNGPYYAMPSWDEQIACTSLTNCPRFEVLTNWSKEAVLDRETGLIWELSPGQGVVGTWVECSSLCIQLKTGGRLGWRMPTVQELASLVDPTQTTYPYLPKGNPFTNIAPESSPLVWSATFFAGNTLDAWALSLATGVLSYYASAANSFNCWCVRGGQGVNPQ